MGDFDFHIHRDSVSPPARETGADEEERISFESLARLAQSAAPPPLPEWENVAPTPAAPSTPAPASAEARRRIPSGLRLVGGVVLGLSLGVAGALIKDALIADDTAAAAAPAAGVQAEPATPAPAAPGPSSAVAPAAVPSAPSAPAAPTSVDRAEPVAVASAEPVDPPAPERAVRDRLRTSRAASEEPPRAARAPTGRVEDAAREIPEPVAEEETATEQKELTAAEAPEPEPAPARRIAPPRPTSLAGLMEAAAPEQEAQPEAVPAHEPEPQVRTSPARQEVGRAMDSIRAGMRECAAGEHGLAELEITVGSSGRVRSALVGGHFAGSRAGSCMARTARAVRFEPFEQDVFTFRYPFRL